MKTRSLQSPLPRCGARGRYALVAAAVVAGTSASALLAQPCSDVARVGVPDFDQVRSLECGPGIPGLPGDGGSFCYPTSLANWMAFFANHGFSELSTPAGPQDWQSPALYDAVTLMIGELGTYMGTGLGGTPSSWPAGFAEYVEAHAPYEGFTINNYAIFAEEAGDDLFAMAANVMRAGGFIVLGIQWSTIDPSTGVYIRGRGHLTSLVSIEGPCERQPLVMLHDPGHASGNECTQSVFTPKVSTCTYITALFDQDADPVTPPITASRFRLDGYTGSNKAIVFGGVRAFMPSYLVGGSNPITQPGCLVFVRPRWWDFDPLPPVEIVALPFVAPVRQVVMSPAMTTVYVTTAAVGGTDPIPARLLRYDIAARSFETLAEYPDVPDLVAFDRFGELYFRSGGMLQRYDVRGAAPVPRAGRSAPGPIDAVVYDDATDELVGVCAYTGGIVRWPRDLESETRLALPVTLGAPGSVALSPMTNRLWVASSQSNVVHELLIDSGGQLVLGRQAVLPGLRAGVDSFKIDAQERLLVVSDSQLLLFRQVRGDSWEPVTGSPFHGVDVGPVFAITRSRDNFTGSARADFEIGPDQTLPSSCPADQNGDGVANSQDFFDFLMAFFAASRAADFNNDDIVNSQDFFDFLTAFFGGC